MSRILSIKYSSPDAGPRASADSWELAASNDSLKATVWKLLAMWPYCSHDGVPCGGEDVGVVVALVMSLQLLGEVLSRQLGRSGEAKKKNR